MLIAGRYFKTLPMIPFLGKEISGILWWFYGGLFYGGLRKEVLKTSNSHTNFPNCKCLMNFTGD